ncbi:putative glycoside hydrolase 43 family protein, partial [Paenibacillus sp. 598K]
MIAEGGTEYGHMVTIARSRRPDGPYESNPDNPILSHRSLARPIQATGHADLVQAADGRWWAVCLGTRPVGYPNKHHLGRETFLAPVHWTEEGWPIIGAAGTIDETMSSEGLRLQPDVPLPIREDFESDTLAPCWNFLRSPDPSRWSLTERTSALTLRGTPVTLDDGGAPAFGALG